jgi:membrane protease YdiL (CAAX protease family)
MENADFFSYTFLLFSVLSLWVFKSKFFATISFFVAIIIACYLDIIDIYSVMFLISFGSALWLYFKKPKLNMYIKHFLWFSVAVSGWFISFSLIEANLNFFNQDLDFASNYVSDYLAINFDRVCITLMICFFAMKPIGKWSEFKLLMTKVAPIYLAAIIVFLSVFYFSGDYEFSLDAPNYWLIWIVLNFLVDSFSEEALYRLLIQNKISESIRSRKFRAPISIILSALLYATSYQYGTMPEILIIFLKGVFLGVIFARCGRIEVSAFLNTTINALQIMIYSRYM